MLGAIKDAVMGIIDFITSIAEFISSIITNTLNFVQAFSEVMVNLPDWLSYFPSFLFVSIMGLFALQIVLRLVGR